MKHRPSPVSSLLALNKHTCRAGAGALRELRETIIGLLRERDETMCAECVATALGQRVGVVIMSILGVPDRFVSFQGVCSACHRHAPVIRREAPGG
jgi:hypothetical protein